MVNMERARGMLREVALQASDILIVFKGLVRGGQVAAGFID